MRLWTLIALLFVSTAATAAEPSEISTFEIPIRANLTMLTAEVEARVPKKFKDTVHERGFVIEYDVARDPIRLEMIGAGLHASTVARYWLQVCRGPACLSCGLGEPRREAAIRLHSAIAWDPSWRIRSTTKPLPLDFPKRCRPFGFDVTDRFIAPIVREQLDIAAKTIDRNTPGLTNARPMAQQIWSSLQTPAEIAERTWLVLEPEEVSLAPISGKANAVASTLTLRAQTRVIVGDKPAAVARPLPALKVANATGGGVRVPFDLELSYADATRLASAEFAGKTFDVNGRPLKVKTLTIAPSENGKLVVEANIDYRSYHGVVVLEGTPRFDAATSSVVIPDLDYKLRNNVFLRIADRFAHAVLRDRLREAARFNLATRLAQLRTDIGKALTRPLAPGVMMRAQANAIQPQTVNAAPNAVIVHVVATGTAEVEVR